MTKIPDKELVQGYLAGNSQYVEVLVSGYYLKVYSLALKVLGNEADAKDITQDTFIRILEKLHQFKYRSSLQTWILNITYNLCMNQLNAAKRYTFSIDLFADTEQPVQADNELDDFSYEDLQISFQKLASEDQLYLELFYLNECSVRDIANILSKSETAVKTAIFRARTKLKQLASASKVNG